MNVAYFIGEMKELGCTFKLEPRENNAPVVVIWYPSFEVEDYVKEIVTLLRRHRAEVVQYLGTCTTALSRPLNDPASDPPSAEEPAWSDDFSGTLQIQERDLELILGGEAVSAG